VHLHLSKLQANRRHEHHLRLAVSLFDPLLHRFDAQLFTLTNGDLMLVTKDTPLLEIDAVLAKLRGIFADDPLVYRSTAGGDGFTTFHVISNNPQAFVSLCNTILNDTVARHQTTKASSVVTASSKELRALDAAGLTALSSVINSIDIGPFVRLQRVVALEPDGSHDTVFSELYVSVADVQRAHAPGVDLLARRWLFHALTRDFDRRVIAYLDAADPATLPRAFSINLDLPGLDAQAMIALARIYERLSDRQLFIEASHLDAFVDLRNFSEAFARLQAMGYRIFLDGLCHHTLPLINRARLKTDFLKIRWSSALEKESTAFHAARSRQAVQHAGAQRVILCHCDSAAAITWGRSLGIKLFQGRHIDHMIEAAPEATKSPPATSAARR
jgi:EAL domain-containing protein (putative c-di-GMP-specific phosphodiesterase class I)